MVYDNLPDLWFDRNVLNMRFDSPFSTHYNIPIQVKILPSPVVHSFFAKLPTCCRWKNAPEKSNSETDSFVW
jgi:hypothetical protein